MARRIADEIVRVLRPGGALLWYDMRVDNPWNRDVRGLPARSVRELFAGQEGRLELVTLVPPIARRLGPLTSVAYPVQAGLPFLRSHLVGVHVRPEWPPAPPRETGQPC